MINYKLRFMNKWNYVFDRNYWIGPLKVSKFLKIFKMLWFLIVFIDWSGVLEEGNRLFEEDRKSDFLHEELIGHFKVLLDEGVAALVTYGAEEILFFVFAYHHLIRYLDFCEHLIYKHEVLGDIVLEGVCLWIGKGLRMAVCLWWWTSWGKYFFVDL